MKISKGVQWMLMATLLFSTMQVMVKKLDYIPFYELIFFRALVSFVISFASIKYYGMSLMGNNKKMLVLRGVFGVGSLAAFFYSLHNAPLGTVITIVNIKPFLILVIAALFLREKVYWQQWIFFLVSFSGILIIKGFDTHIGAFEIGTVILSAVFAAVAHTLVRVLGKSDDALHTVFYFTLVTVPIFGPISFMNWVSPAGWYDWSMVIGIGVITHFGQLFLTKAYQLDEMSSISSLYYLGIPLAIVFGYLFFDEQYTSATAMGIGLVVIGILSNAWLVSKKK